MKNKRAKKKNDAIIRESVLPQRLKKRRAAGAAAAYRCSTNNPAGISGQNTRPSPESRSAQRRSRPPSTAARHYQQNATRGGRGPWRHVAARGGAWQPHHTLQLHASARAPRHGGRSPRRPPATSLTWLMIRGSDIKSWTPGCVSKGETKKNVANVKRAPATAARPKFTLQRAVLQLYSAF